MGVVAVYWIIPSERSESTALNPLAVTNVPADCNAVSNSDVAEVKSRVYEVTELVPSMFRARIS